MTTASTIFSIGSTSFMSIGLPNFLKSRNYKYYYIRSIKFYKSIIDKISKSSNVSLKLGENTKKIIKYKNYYKVITNKNIYVSNEAFCKHQCWIEGSLSMAKDLIQLLLQKKTLKKGGARQKKRRIQRKTKKLPIHGKQNLETI